MLGVFAVACIRTGELLRDSTSAQTAGFTTWAGMLMTCVSELSVRMGIRRQGLDYGYYGLYDNFRSVSLVWFPFSPRADMLAVLDCVNRSQEMKS